MNLYDIAPRCPFQYCFMEKILSIIIPTYNMEKYLRKCLDSLIVEDKEMFGQLEVLVINDGSKDSSSALAHEYQDGYPNVFRVIDKENGNYGSCVNRGLKEATGKYVKILDADDYFSYLNFEKFINYISQVDDDLILSDYDKVSGDGIILEHHQYEVEPYKSLIFEMYCSTTTIKGIQMHGVTYKTEKLRCINYIQTEGISYTDQEWIFKPMLAVSTFSYFKHSVYKYLIGRNGQTMDSNVIVRSMEQFKLMTYSLARTYEIIDENCSKRKYFDAKLIDNIKFVYNRALLRRNLSIDLLNAYDKKLKTDFPKSYNVTNSAGIHLKFPFKFIKYYRRKRNYLPFYVNVIYKIMRG